MADKKAKASINPDDTLCRCRPRPHSPAGLHDAVIDHKQGVAYRVRSARCAPKEALRAVDAQRPTTARWSATRTLHLSA